MSLLLSVLTDATHPGIKELFETVGPVKRVAVKDGVAEVTFSKFADAEAAMKEYHNIALDGTLCVEERGDFSPHLVVL